MFSPLIATSAVWQSKKLKVILWRFFVPQEMNVKKIAIEKLYFSLQLQK
jgi:hypothetical protein